MVVKKKTKVVRKKKAAKTAKNKATRKKPQRKAASAPSRRAKGKALGESQLVKIGEVTHYFPKVKAAAILVLRDGLKPGDPIYIKGHTTDFKQTAKSMQLDHVTIDGAKKGQEIGLLVRSRVRIGDTVYRV